MKLDNFR